MNSLQFSLARVLGPLAGAFVLEGWGPSVSFATNAAGYVIVLSTVATLRPRPSPAGAGGGGWEQIREGWRYTLSHSSLTLACVTTAMIAFCGWSLMSLSPALAREHLGSSASKTGLLTAANGIGASLAAVLFALFAQRFARSTTARLAMGCWLVGITVVGAASSLAPGLAGFFIMGFAHTTMVTSLQPALQHQVDDRYRGRVLAVYMQGVLIGPPAGAFLFAGLSGLIGLRAVIFVIASLLASYVALVLARFEGFRMLDADDAVPRRGREWVLHDASANSKPGALVTPRTSGGPNRH
jgi:predicted MFS family arabinose efflux permease